MVSRGIKHQDADIVSSEWKLTKTIPLPLSIEKPCPCHNPHHSVSTGLLCVLYLTLLSGLLLPSLSSSDPPGVPFKCTIQPVPYMCAYKHLPKM